MSPKTKQIVGWVLAGLISALFLFSASGKLMPNEESLKMAGNFGLDASAFKMLGVVELVSVLLFLYPRTGVLGTLLLASYMGGAIATHLEHGDSIVAPCVIQAVLWIVAVFRFPELKSRIMSNS
ncbi:MAG: DoxX family protein [Saprospiraceae bacterium]|nr:DoxX family protein [Saprospiraceae bacterium]